MDNKNTLATLDKSENSQNFPVLETNLLKKLGLKHVDDVYILLDNIKRKELEYTNSLNTCTNEHKKTELENQLKKVISAKNTLLKEMKNANLPEVQKKSNQIIPFVETPPAIIEDDKNKNNKNNIFDFFIKHKKYFYIGLTCIPVAFIIYLLTYDNRSTAELNQIGYGYYLQENYDKSIKYLEKSVKRGDYTQLSLIGDIYFYGSSSNAFEVDFENAFKLYTMSSNNSDDLNQSYSQYQLGNMYYNGLGIEQDLNKAVEFYELSADNGYTLSSKIVGDMYYHGDEIDKNSSKALYYYQKCNSVDMYITQYYIGNIYFAGSGVPQDYIQALNWYKKASTNKITEASYMAGYMYENGLGTDVDYSLSIDYYTKGVDDNHIQSMYNLAELYSNNLKEYELAFEYYQKSADLGYVESMYKVADMYSTGTGTTRHSLKAEEYLELAKKSEAN